MAELFQNTTAGTVAIALNIHKYGDVMELPRERNGPCLHVVLQRTRRLLMI